MSSAQSTVQRIESTFDAIEAHVRQPNRDLLWHRHLGTLLRDTNPADTPAANYGRRWLAAVRRRTGLKRELVYKAMQFAVLCSDAETARWNGRVRWSQLVAVLSVKDESARAAILTDAFRLRWGCRQISAAVGRRLRNRPPRGGRPRRWPVSKGPARDVVALNATLADIEATIADIVARPGGTVDELLDRTKPLPARVRRKIEQLRDRLRQVQPALVSVEADLAVVLGRDDARHHRPSA